MPRDSTRAPHSYETFVYGNSADEPTRLAERSLEVIEGTLKSVDRVVARLRAGEMELKRGSYTGKKFEHSRQ